MLTESETLDHETVKTARVAELDSAVAFQYVKKNIHFTIKCCRVSGALEHGLQFRFTVC